MNAIQQALHESYQFAMVRVCFTCGGHGWVDDKSNARVAKTFGGPITSNTVPPPVKCVECVNGWMFKEVDGKQLRDWLIEELRQYAQANPAEVLNTFVAASEAVLVRDP